MIACVRQAFSHTKSVLLKSHENYYLANLKNKLFRASAHEPFAIKLTREKNSLVV